jgi:predicted metal-binding membrane protein
MAHQLHQKNSTGCDEATLPIKFIVVCVFTFIAGVSATVYFCGSMCCDMEMPGGWTMSMMWMRMPGQTWLASTLGFILMWLAMMVSMMLPSALPMFLKTRRQWTSLCLMASGYFSIWLIAGVGIYALGIAWGRVTMESEIASRAVPFFSGASLIIAGTVQLTPWKKTHLLSCRSPFGCTVSCRRDKTSFRLGCKQGVACCVCCAAPMAIQLVIGIMNPLLMIAVSLGISAEKILPRPAIAVVVIGIAAIVAGLATVAGWL